MSAADVTQVALYLLAGYGAVALGCLLIPAVYRHLGGRP